MVSAETPSKNCACVLNLFTNHVGDSTTKSYTQCIILGLLLLVKLHTFAFEVTENAIMASKRVKRL